MKKEIRAAKVIEVIEIRCTRGEGTQEDPVREVTQYWDLKGEKIFESDPKKN